MEETVVTTCITEHFQCFSELLFFSCVSFLSLVLFRLWEAAWLLPSGSVPTATKPAIVNSKSLSITMLLMGCQKAFPPSRTKRDRQIQWSRDRVSVFATASVMGNTVIARLRISPYPAVLVLKRRMKRLTFPSQGHAFAPGSTEFSLSFESPSPLKSGPFLSP